LFLFLLFSLRLFSPCWTTPSVNYRPSITGETENGGRE
jgi:hypothetical protein